MIIFDFDFTLAKTIENIWVWSPRGNLEHNGKKYISVHPYFIQKNGICDDEEINEESFIEFSDINLEKTKIIWPVFEYFKLYNLLNKEITILSARPQCVEEKVFLLLSKNKIDTSKVKFVGLKNSLAEEKIKFILNKIKENKDFEITIFEDNDNVLRLAKKCLPNFIDLKFMHIKNFLNKTEMSFYG